MIVRHQRKYTTLTFLLCVGTLTACGTGQPGDSPEFTSSSSGALGETGFDAGGDTGGSSSQAEASGTDSSNDTTDTNASSTDGGSTDGGSTDAGPTDGGMTTDPDPTTGTGDGGGDGGGDGDGDGDGDSSTDEGGGMPDSMLAEPGEFAVYIEDPVSIPGHSQGRVVEATICGPSDDGGATLAAGAAPLIITSPGAVLARTEFQSYCEHLASWGFVVVNQSIVGNDGLTPPANHALAASDVSSIIDWAVDSASPIVGSIDTTRIGVAGHSMGGKVSMLAAARDNRIGAVVGWDPVDANGPNTQPGSAEWTSAAPEEVPNIQGAVAVLGEKTNGGPETTGFFPPPPCAPDEQNFEAYYSALSSPALLVDFAGADHMDWTDSGNGGGGFASSACSPGQADDAWVREITRIVNVAWFSRHLKDDMSMDAAAAIGTMSLTVQSK